MGYTFSRYFLRLVLPFTALGVLTFSLSVIFADLFGPMRFMMYVMAVFFPLVGVFYPKIWVDRRRREIEQNIHQFITNAGVLAAANVERMEIFRSLAGEKELYGPLADEIEKVVTLVDTWRLSLEEACRYVSERTPSDILSDFLERLSHTTEAGEDVRRFLIDEQEVVISDYESMYEDSIHRARDLRDLFLSMILATVFLVVFSIIMPFLTGFSPFLMIGIAILVFVVSEIGFILGTEFILPDDPIWFRPKLFTSREARIGRAEIFSLLLFGLTLGLLSAHLFFGVFSTPFLPISIYLALPLTPLIIPGLMVWREEVKIRNKDENFPSFLRTLAASASAKRAAAANVLETLKEKEFGALTLDIQNLHKRLKMRIDEKLAWDYFFAESGSNLVQRFGEMYSEGVTKGGDPKTVADVITENFKRILRIRERRYDFASSLRGVLYGITVIAAVTFFMGFSFASEMIEEVGQTGFKTIEQVFWVRIYDPPGVHFMLVGLVLLNALLIAFYIRTVSSCDARGVYAHAVLLLWAGVVGELVVENFIRPIVAI